MQVGVNVPNNVGTLDPSLRRANDGARPTVVEGTQAGLAKLALFVDEYILAQSTVFGYKHTCFAELRPLPSGQGGSKERLHGERP